MPRTLATRTPLAALAALGVSLGACAPDRAVTGSTYPHDHHERHPIMLTDAPRTLDVFVNGRNLDPRQRDDLWAFAQEFRRHGQGSIGVQVPQGAANGALAARTLDEVRAMFAQAGLASAPLLVSSYVAADPRAASVIRLSFRRLQAKVASRCGLFPQDLGGSDPKFNASNQPFWNLGCSSQSTLAAQVADPVDLVRGRTEVPGDTLRRTKDIQDLRDGKDPSTVYRQDDKNRINESFGRN